MPQKKSFLAVIQPQAFTPAIMDDAANFDMHWQQQPDWVLSNLSHLVYFRSEQIEAFMQQLGVEKTIVYDQNGAQAMLAIWHDKAILSFRGTQLQEYDDQRQPAWLKKFMLKYFSALPLNPFALFFPDNDVLADLNFLQTRFGTSDAKVHRGFLAEFSKIWPAITQDLQQLNDKPVWVTGHSLGGAMAHLAGLSYPFKEVVTFGQPRIGRNTAAVFQAQQLRRYVNGDDPVPTLPPAWFGYYRHTGELRAIKDSDGSSSTLFDHAIVYYTENIT